MERKRKLNYSFSLNRAISKAKKNNDLPTNTSETPENSGNRRDRCNKSNIQVEDDILEIGQTPAIRRTNKYLGLLNQRPPNDGYSTPCKNSGAVENEPIPSDCFAYKGEDTSIDYKGEEKPVARNSVKPPHNDLSFSSTCARKDSYIEDDFFLEEIAESKMIDGSVFEKTNFEDSDKESVLFGGLTCTCSSESEKEESKENDPV